MKLLKYALPNPPRSAFVRLNGRVLSYDVGDSVYEVVHTVDLAEVVSALSQDSGCIAVGIKGGMGFSVETTALTHGVRGTIHTLKQGRIKRDTPMAAYMAATGEGNQPIAFIFTPFRGCALEDVMVYLLVSGPDATNKIDILVDGEPVVADSAGLANDILHGYQPITLSQVSHPGAGKVVEFTVAAGPSTTVYLDCLGGSVNKTRAVDGDSIKWDLSSLVSGTTARVKAGYKYWPGKTDLEVTVP